VAWRDRELMRLARHRKEQKQIQDNEAD